MQISRVRIYRQRDPKTNRVCLLCSMSGKKASVPRSERAKWRGREKRRKR